MLRQFDRPRVSFDREQRFYKRPLPSCHRLATEFVDRISTSEDSGREDTGLARERPCGSLSRCATAAGFGTGASRSKEDSRTRNPTAQLR